MIDQIGVIYQGASQISINKNIINFVDEESFNDKMKFEYGYKLGVWYKKIISCLEYLLDCFYGISTTTWNMLNEKCFKSYREKKCPTIDINKYREDIVCLEDTYFGNY
jgi:hypothetical protein